MQERIERIALRNRFFSGEYWEFLELALGTSKLMCTYVVLVVCINKVIVLQLVRTVVCFSSPPNLVKNLFPGLFSCVLAFLVFRCFFVACPSFS